MMALAFTEGTGSFWTVWVEVSPPSANGTTILSHVRWKTPDTSSISPFSHSELPDPVYFPLHAFSVSGEHL